MVFEIAKEVTNRYLYAQESTPANLVDDVWIRPTTVNPTPVMNFNKQNFMTTGAGRFALPRQFEVVNAFFAADNSLFTPDTSYSLSSILSILGLDSTAAHWNMFQTNYQDGIDDYVERTYIFNSSSFEITDGAAFSVNSGGQKKIEGLKIAPRGNDNFDMVGSGLAQYLNGVLEPLVDPSKIGRTVDLNFTGDVQALAPYNSVSYAADLDTMNTWNGLNPVKLGSDGIELINALFVSGVTRFLDADERPIVYGTIGNDDLSADKITLTDFPFLWEHKDNGVVLIGGAGNDSLTGGEYNDSLWGGAGADTFQGNAGDDTILAGEADALINGGAGTDLLDLSKLTISALVNLPANWMFINGQFTTVQNIENILGTSYNDFLIGNGSDNTLEGGDGDDRLSGNGGTDSLIGGVGNDTLEGGDGDDRFTVQLGLGSQAGGDGFDVFDGGAGTDTVDYSQSDVGLYIHMVNGLNNSADTLISIENLILTQFDDTAFGNDSDNILSGLQGNDSLLGGGFGNDTLLGGAGSDTIKGGWNNDLLEGGDGADVLYANGYSKGQTGEDRIYGGKDNDILHAGGANSPRALYGGDGDDEIFFVPPLTSGGSSLPLITDATVYGGSGMDTIHSNFLKNSMTIADSDGNFTLDFIDATITGMGFDPNGGNPIFVFFADDSDPHADSYLYYSDGSFGEPVGYYFGPLLILAEGENSRPSVWPYDIFIDNVQPYLTTSDVSLANGNIVIHATPQDPTLGAENTSGFSFV